MLLLRVESFAREVRALAVTVYFGSAGLLWAVDSPHLAIVMVHLNMLESILALKIKALNDSVAKAVQQLQNMQLQFALLVGRPFYLSCTCPAQTSELCLLPPHGKNINNFNIGRSSASWKA